MLRGITTFFSVYSFPGSVLDFQLRKEINFDSSEIYEIANESNNINSENVEQVASFFRFIGFLSPSGKVGESMQNGEVWTLEKQLLSTIELNTRTLIWAKTKDAERGRNAPQIILPDNVTRELKRQKESQASQEDFDSLGFTDDVDKVEFVSDFIGFISEKEAQGMTKEEAIELFNNQ